MTAIGDAGVARHRPRPPDRSGTVSRDGVEIGYDVYDGPGPGPTVLLMPTWSIIDSRHWKLQVPYLARHFRVLTFDGRGSGRSGRPAGAAAYTDREFAADAVAVLDATDTPRAVLVALSCGVTWSVHVAAGHPERIAGIVAIGPSCAIARQSREREVYAWNQHYTHAKGWASYNKHHWLEAGTDAFREFFFRQALPEPHSTKLLEDVLAWSAEIEPQTLVDTTAGRLGVDGGREESIVPLCPDVRCPVLVVHGTEDRISPPTVGIRLAELTGGSLELIEGAGHLPHARDPVRLNRLIKGFVETLAPARVRTTTTRARQRPKRALYLSSPIGLGHARRDLAIAQQLRRLHPDLQIDWLTQDPVTRLLTDAGESVHPASSWLASESRHFEDECGEHDLHAFGAIRRMDESLVNNFHVFHDVVSETDYDLVIGDEAWDVDYFLHENPELKRFGFAWMSDFVGWLPMPDGGAAEAALTADYNAEMIEQRARYRRLRDSSIFVGDPGDVVTDPLGPGLPRIRDWTEENFDFAGYVTGFDVPDQAERSRLRARLGYGEDELLCLVSVGGSGVGSDLLRRVLDAVPLARRLLPELRFLVVTGPRIDPSSLPRRRGVTVRGYLPDLYRHLAACDVAVVQGGLTTCMELTAARRPFLYVPLRHHFEQNIHVRHRLDQYGAGRCVTYEEASDPSWLAEAITKEVWADVDYRPVATDGAERAAAMLAELI